MSPKLTFWTGILGFCISASASALDTVVLRLPAGNPYYSVGFVAAQQQGFYQKKKLWVHLDSSYQLSNPIDRVVFGKANFAIAGSEIMDAWALGKPVISLAVLHQKSVQVLITRGSITIPSQLVHHRVALPENASLDVRAMLAKQNVSRDSLVVVETRDPLREFIAGKIDAFVGTLNNEPEVLQRRMVDFNVIRPDQYGIDFYGSSLLTSRYELENFPERVVAFVEASIAGWNYASDHPDKIVTYYPSLPGSPSWEHLRFEAQTFIEQRSADRVRMGDQDLDLWRGDIGILQGLGLFPSGVTIDEQVRSIDQIREEKQSQTLDRAFLITCCAIALVLILSFLTWLFWRGMSRRNAELRQSEARLQQALRATPDAVWELSNRESPMWWSPAAYQLFDLPSDGFIPTWSAMLEHVEMEDRIDLDADMQGVWGAGGAFAREVRIRRDSGIHWLRIRGLASDEGEPRRIFGYFQDIHELKSTGIALRDSEARFRQYFELGLVGMATVDLQGRFLQVNRTLWELMDSSEEDMCSKDWRAFTHPGDLALEEELMESVLRGDRQGYTIDKRFVSQKQKTIFALVAARAVPSANGGISHWVMLIQDISQRRQGELEKENILHQLSLKNRTLEGMLHTISHDFRHPLVNVMWYSQEIERGVKNLTSALQEMTPDLSTQLPPTLMLALDELSEDLPHGMAEVRRGAQQLDRMLSGMLSLSRLGRQPLEMVTVEMRQLLETLIDEMKPQIETVKATLDIGELPPCMGSESMLYQAWRNLLSNALQFREPARPLVIRIHGKMVRDWVVYTIEDNGIGIPASSLGHIFAPFFRLDSAGSQSGEGLGLTFVTRILESHRGHIKVESDLGKGSRFSVYLPKAAVTVE